MTLGHNRKHEIKEKELSNENISNITPSGNNNISPLKKDEIKSKRKNRLVKLLNKINI